jgi:hypothetical protein
MIWKVKSNSEVIELNEFQLLNMLSAKVVETEREDARVLSEMLVRRMQTTDMLSEMTPIHLATMAFEIGYFYRIFKEKNTITFETDEESNDTSISKTRS